MTSDQILSAICNEVSKNKQLKTSLYADYKMTVSPIALSQKELLEMLSNKLVWVYGSRTKDPNGFVRFCSVPFKGAILLCEIHTDLIDDVIESFLFRFTK